MTENSRRTGPIVFANRTARSQLLNHGEVISFRKRDRTTGETWWRKSRTGEKIGDVTVEPIEKDIKPTSDALKQHRELSGFEMVEQWIKAIEDENSGLPESGHLYRVTADEGKCGKCGEIAPLPTNRFCPSCERDEAHMLYVSQSQPR